jgi:hypothetical protein
MTKHNKTSNLKSTCIESHGGQHRLAIQRPATMASNNGYLCAATGCCGSLGFGSKISLRQSLSPLISISARRGHGAASRPSIRRGSWVRSSVSPGDWRLGPRPSAARSGPTGYCQTKKETNFTDF